LERNTRRKAAYAADPEPAKARSRAQYAKDPERWKAQALAWHRANPERHAEAGRKWVQKNLHGLVRESVRRRYATRKGATAIKFTPAQLDQRAAYYGHSCWMCSAPMTEWDHVKPLSKGGWHCLSNLRPICRTCNARKRDTWPLDGLRQTA
jgi:5-methylcytosine-specific restriction endonuclease McrA